VRVCELYEKMAFDFDWDYSEQDMVDRLYEEEAKKFLLDGKVVNALECFVKNEIGKRGFKDD